MSFLKEIQYNFSCTIQGGGVLDVCVITYNPNDLVLHDMHGVLKSNMWDDSVSRRLSWIDHPRNFFS